MSHDARTLINSLASKLCPSCGGSKFPKMTLCGECYRRLPGDLKKALYKRVGKGYENAFTDAMISLDVPAPHFPAPLKDAVPLKDVVPRDITLWAMETLMMAIQVAASEPLPFSAVKGLALREIRAICEAAKAVDPEAENAPREITKRVVRRANAIINDGIAVGVVS